MTTKYKTVRGLLSNPARWTTKAIARNSEGFTVNVQSKEATCFCLLGAVYRVYGKSEFPTDIPQLATIYKELSKLGHDSLTGFNDTTSYEDVIKLVKKLKI
jgi:hypothetical protein